jgi:hypothetical protein
MQYQIIAIKQDKLDQILQKLKQSFAGVSLVDPELFLPLDKVYNTHHPSSNYVAKLRASSSLCYLFVEIPSNKILELVSLCNQLKAHTETVVINKTRDQTIFKRILTFFILLMHIDIGFCLLTYLLNFNLFKANKSLSDFNIGLVIGGLVGALGVNLFGLSFLQNYLKPIINLKPLTQNSWYLVFGIIFCFISTLLFRILFNNKDFKLDFVKPKQIVTDLKLN